MTSTRPYPRCLVDQNFGLCIAPDDTIFPFYYNCSSNYCRPWRWFNQTGTRDSGSTINEENNVFKITLDVQHFKPEEIKVKVNDNEIIVEAKHEEKLDEHGFISRQFKRRYILPYECPSDTVECILSSDGILILTAKKMTKTVTTKEIIVPIQICAASKKLENTETNCSTKTTENDSKSIQSSTGEPLAIACSKDNQIIAKEDKYTTKITESDTKTLQRSTGETLALAFSKDNQIISKEDNCSNKTTESGTKKLQSSTGETLAMALRKDNQIMSKEDNCTTKTTESDNKTLQSSAVETLAMGLSKDMLKEDHCRLLKPELLGAAVSESKRAEELNQITEQEGAKSKTFESENKFEVSSEATTTKVAETQLMEKSKYALSDNNYAGLGSISTINDQCQMTSDKKDINRISELSSALEEASATALSTTENIAQLVENMNVSGTSSKSQEIMEILETSSSKSSASAMTSREEIEVSKSKLRESMNISESLGTSSARSGVNSTIEDMMDKCSAEIAEITNKYSDPGFMSASGTAKMQSMSYSSSEMQESSYSSSTVKSSGESASILVSDVMAELREAAENIGK